jgi:hypothetical protein
VIVLAKIAARSHSDFGFRPSFDLQPSTFSLSTRGCSGKNLTVRPSGLRKETRLSREHARICHATVRLLRASDFGFRPSFDLRPSTFGLTTRCPPT